MSTSMFPSAPRPFLELSLSERPLPHDLAAIKRRQQATWASADFGHIGVRLQIVGESLCESVDVVAGEQVIDVAAGNGNAALAAARRFASVTATDYVPQLLEQGRRRARAERLHVDFQLADAEQLPFPDDSFDVALSTFGVMFAPNQERAAGELVRVVRPGGRIGLANWTPEGFIGRLFEVMAEFVPTPPGLHSPMEWGTEARIQELFGSVAGDVRTQRKSYAFRFRSPAHWIEFFNAYYGPIHKLFAGLDASGQRGLYRGLDRLLRRQNQHGGDALVVPSEYLEVMVTK